MAVLAHWIMCHAELSHPLCQQSPPPPSPGRLNQRRPHVPLLVRSQPHATTQAHPRRALPQPRDLLTQPPDVAAVRLTRGRNLNTLVAQGQGGGGVFARCTPGALLLY